MIKPVIKKSIEINAPVKDVWSVFTNPTLTREMGGEYVSEWKVGSFFGWKGLNGVMYTNGMIIDIEVEKVIKHNLFDLTDQNKLLSVITYEFIANKEGTLLIAKEELNSEVTAEQLSDIAIGWDYALNAVKEVAEK